MTSPVTLGVAGLYRAGTVRTKLRRFGPPLSAGGPLPAIGHGLEIGGDIQATTKGRRLSIPQVVAPLCSRNVCSRNEHSRKRCSGRFGVFKMPSFSKRSGDHRDCRAQNPLTTFAIDGVILWSLRQLSRTCDVGKWSSSFHPRKQPIDKKDFLMPTVQALSARVVVWCAVSGSQVSPGPWPARWCDEWVQP